MNTSLVIACLAFACAAGASAARPSVAPAPPALQATLVDLEKQSWVAWQHHDGAFFDRFLADNHVEVGFGGPTSKPDVVAFVGSSACTVRSYAVDHFALAMLGKDTALLTYHAAQDTTCGGNAVPSPVWVSSLFVRRNGQWRNALYQQSPTAK